MVPRWIKISLAHAVLYERVTIPCTGSLMGCIAGRYQQQQYFGALRRPPVGFLHSQSRLVPLSIEFLNRESARSSRAGARPEKEGP